MLVFLSVIAILNLFITVPQLMLSGLDIDQTDPERIKEQSIWISDENPKEAQLLGKGHILFLRASSGDLGDFYPTEIQDIAYFTISDLENVEFYLNITFEGDLKEDDFKIGQKMGSIDEKYALELTRKDLTLGFYILNFKAEIPFEDWIKQSSNLDFQLELGTIKIKNTVDLFYIQAIKEKLLENKGISLDVQVPYIDYE